MTVEEQQQQNAFGNLNSLLGTANSAGSSFGKQGQQNLAGVEKYFQSLLSGDKAATAGAVAPAANSATAASDAQRKEHADMGTARTGGTAALNQMSADQLRAYIGNLIGAQKGTAAQELKGISDTELSAMMNALGLSASASGTEAGVIGADLASRRQASSSMWSSLLGGIAKFAANAVPALFTGGTSLAATLPATLSSIPGPSTSGALPESLPTNFGL